MDKLYVRLAELEKSNPKFIDRIFHLEAKLPREPGRPWIPSLIFGISIGTGLMCMMGKGYAISWESVFMIGTIGSLVTAVIGFYYWIAECNPCLSTARQLWNIAVGLAAEKSAIEKLWTDEELNVLEELVMIKNNLHSENMLRISDTFINNLYVCVKREILRKKAECREFKPWVSEFDDSSIAVVREERNFGLAGFQSLIETDEH